MIHSGSVGSMERVVSALMERCQARLPFWLALTQIAVLPVTTKHGGHRGTSSTGYAPSGSEPGSSTTAPSAPVSAPPAYARPPIGVIGEREIRHDTVHVTDASAHVRTTIAAAELLDRMTTVYHARHPHIDWPS